MSDTPKTDDATWHTRTPGDPIGADVVYASFAAGLERELSAVTKERDEALAMLGCYAMDKSDLKARIKRLEESGDDLAKIIGPPGSDMWADEPESDRAYLAWTQAKEAR